MSTIEDGATGRIISDREDHRTKGRLDKTPFSNQGGKEEISKDGHKISIKGRSRVYKGKRDNEQRHNKKMELIQDSQVAKKMIRPKAK
jgi:DNA/RNA endonuclease YhcR with UshA esterase domain